MQLGITTIRDLYSIFSTHSSSIVTKAGKNHSRKSEREAANATPRKTERGDPYVEAQLMMMMMMIAIVIAWQATTISTCHNLQPRAQCTPGHKVGLELSFDSVSTRSLALCLNARAHKADDRASRKEAANGKRQRPKGRFAFCPVVADIWKHRDKEWEAKRETAWVPISKRYLKETLLFSSNIAEFAEVADRQQSFEKHLSTCLFVVIAKQKPNSNPNQTSCNC